MNNIRHKMSLMESPGGGSMNDVVQTKSTSQAAGLDEEKRMDKSSNECFAWHMSLFLSVKLMLSKMRISHRGWHGQILQ